MYRTTNMHSLGAKFAILVFLLTVVASSCIAYAMLQIQEDVLLEQERVELNAATQRFAEELDKVFWQREKKAIKANQIVTQALHQRDGVTTSALQPATRLKDGSLRTQDDTSGAFQAEQAFLRQPHDYFQRSGSLWQTLSPVMLEDFFTFYFISNDGFVRISPAEWAMEVDVNHDFRRDLFFSIASPEQNQARLPRWTPVYYDSIWEKWMVSLIIPVYVEDKFIGITGADLELDELLKHLSRVGQWEHGRKTLLLDPKGHILLSEKRQKNSSKFKMNQSLEPELLPDPQLRDYIQRVIANPAERPLLSRSVSDRIVASATIERLGWQVLVYHDYDSILANLRDNRNKVILVFLLVALVVAAALQVFVYKLILRRLYALVHAVQRFANGSELKAPLDTHTDEIGMLNRAFLRMSEEMKQLIDGLNHRILEKEGAEREARKLSKAVAFSSSGLVITDQHLAIEYTNPFLLEMLGCAPDDVMHKDLSMLYAREMGFVSDDIRLSLKERQHWRGDMLLEFAHKQFWVSLAIAPIRDDRGVVSHYVCAMQDISFIKESQRKMEQLAYFDVLTGLANRSYFRDQLRKAIAMASRGYYHFALLYFDLDEFKRINDTLGHDAGDELLKEVARRLTSRLREEDTIARLGGDEFAVLLSGISNRKQAASIAENLRQSFALPVKLAGHDMAISASIGITLAPEDAIDEELLLKHADLAMYEAKARGKNTYHFFSQDLNDAANERLQIESQLREALREQQFMLYYQPKLDIRTETIVGYETLLRWLRPDNSMIPPLKFIPVAESTGLIVQIGEWIIWEACRFLTRQHARGHLITVSINLSARQFTDSDLPALIERIIKRTGAPASHLIFEITESMLMGDTDAAINQLNELKRLGLSLSIDDFGTGYSSLSYLKRFPVDELKIDRSFVKDIPDDKNDMDITAAIIAMAQKMDLRVVAEGVETAEQVTFLQQNACYLVQGYFYSMPLAEQELSRLTYKSISI